MKTYFFLISYVILFFYGRAQMQAAHWIFGKNTHINFTFGSNDLNINNLPSAINPNALIPNSTLEGSATISDVNGNLKLYTNGINVYNNQHTQLNLNRLRGNNTVTQSSIFIPYPGKYNQYILFTINAMNHIAPRNDVSTGFHFGLYYYVIDLNQNNGEGQLIIPNENRLLDRVAEKISAVYHANEKDIWVVTYYENKFYSYLVTENGVQEPIISVVPYFSSLSGYAANSKGYMKISPTGDKIAIAHQNEVIVELLPESSYSDGFEFFSITNLNPNFPGKLLTYDFNKSTGIVNNERKFRFDLLYYGLEFSPNGKNLYFRYLEDIYNVVMVTDPNNLESFSSVQQFDSNTLHWMGALNLGVNGKIYTSTNASKLSIIDKPNNNLTEFLTNQQSLNLNGQAGLGLPNFIVDYLKEEIKILNTFNGKDACINTPLKFWVNNNQEVQSISWDFGNGNHSNEIVPENTYTSSGTYIIRVVINGILYEKTIIIHEPLNLPEYLMKECDSNGDGYTGYNLKTFVEFIGDRAEHISFHNSRENAELNIDAIENLVFQGNSDSPAIWARIIGKGGCISFTKISFGFEVTSIIPQNQSLCLQFENYYFINPQDLESLYESPVTIHNSAEDAENYTNPITENLIIEENQNDITLYVRQRNFEACDDIIRLHLTLYKPIIVEVEDQTICPDQTSAYFTIPFTPDIQFIQWLGLTNEDLNQNTNSNSIRISNPGEYKVRVTNRNGCTFEETFNLYRKENIRVTILQGERGSYSINYLDNDSSNYEFSIDRGITWKTGTIIGELEFGPNEIWIRELNGLNCIVYREIILHNYIPNFFSPNDDGINDNWVIKGFEKFDYVDVEIYNRHGKMLLNQRIIQNNIMWNGRLNGIVQKSTSYWYRLITSTNLKFEGYVTIKN